MTTCGSISLSEMPPSTPISKNFLKNRLRQYVRKKESIVILDVIKIFYFFPMMIFHSGSIFPNGGTYL